MTRRFGSNIGFQSDNRGGVIDEVGNTVISSDTEFAASPLGAAALTQAQYQIPNGTFNLLPPNPSSAIVTSQNDLPYWSIADTSDGQITAIPSSTSGNVAIEVRLGTAAAGATLTLATRQFVVSDTNMGVTEYVFSRLQRFGNVTVPSQWNVVLKATQYNASDTALSTATIGTIQDNSTDSQFYGELTVNSTARYIDFEFVVTAALAITGSSYFKINNLIVGTKSIVDPKQGRVYQAFNASSSWVVPAGVKSIDVIAVGAGGGGSGGGFSTSWAGANNLAGTGLGGPPGGASGWGYAPNVGVIPSSTVTVTIGAGGAGGTAYLYDKPAGTAVADRQINPPVGGSGGVTTVSTSHGTIISAAGGGGGGTTTVGAIGSVTVNSAAGLAIAAGAAATSDQTLMGSPASSAANRFLPFWESTRWQSGVDGETAYVGATNDAFTVLGDGGAELSLTGFSAGGAWGGSAVSTTTASNTAITVEDGGDARYGASGGGGAIGSRVGSATTDITFFAGLGEWGYGYGCGGSGGGGLRANRGAASTSLISSIDVYVSSGAGGNGADGFVLISYTTPGTAV